MRTCTLACRLLTCCVLVASVAVCDADDWPQWRGLNRDGVIHEPGLMQTLPGDALPRRWTVPVGPGYSGPAVVDGRVFLTDRQADGAQQFERILCFDADTGETLWTQVYEAVYTIGYKAGPRASVTVHDDRALAVGAMGHFHCLDVETGEVLWRRDLASELDIQMPIWGIAGAPLVVQDKVIQIAGGKGAACVIAMDLQSGETVWSSLDEPAGYSAPILIRQGGQDVVVCWTGASVSGLDPQTGEVFWSIPLKPRNMPINVATPVTDGEHLFVSSFYDGAMMIRLDSDRPAATRMWHRIGRDEQNTDALHCMISSPFLQGDYVYGTDSYGELRCLEIATGDRVWESDAVVPRARWATVHTIHDGSRLIMLNDQGELIFGRVSPSGYSEVARTQLLSPTKIQLPRRGGVTWSHPAIADGVIYARNDEQLIAASLQED
ncbi:PQQ-binding-like beta-propeller repeat protein [Roseimaritima sediminicola]|uniref:PQQ-binding-like beta-propeller repeat protein n=1 Tax=Roseimaritima sediminicola TaxID=2662066 RepID=UPI00129842C1|nr:PQQ-binding-like beta-propeller repeat protein [Roseimaritima sediminicola]